MKLALPLIAALVASTPAFAQDTIGTGPNHVSVDIGLGAAYKPSYQGSDEFEASPWLIMRDLRLRGYGAGENSGFSISPNVNLVGKRNNDDDDRLEGMDEIDYGYELGLKATYNVGQTTAYATMRKGFGGHHGVVGEFGADYRFKAGERWTMWVGAEAKYGDSKFNDTYFGVSEGESVTSGYDAYEPGGGINAASARFEARYSLTDSTAVIGEVKYTRLLGDTADSPLVEKKSQPSIRLGVIHRLNFNF